MEIKDIMYLVLWAGLGAYCFFYAHRLSPILYILGGFFVFMFAWYLINDLLPVNLFDGTYNIVFRIICAVFLGVAILAYVIAKRKSR